MATFVCTKETYFAKQLYRVGETYTGSDAPKAYFTEVKSGGEAKKPGPSMSAQGRKISEDEASTLAPKDNK